MKCLCLASALCSFVLSAQEYPSTINSAEIKSEKQELRSGEITKLTIFNFRNDNGKPYQADTNVIVSDRIIVCCDHGEILDGTTWVNPDFDHTIIGNCKIFLLRNHDKIEFYYRAPLRNVSEVEITAYNSTSIGPLHIYPLEGSDDGYLISKAKLKINNANYLLLNYSEAKQVKWGKVTYEHTINAVIRIDLKTSPIPNSLQVTNLEVLEINGRADRISSDEHLVARAGTAQASAYNRLVMLNMNPQGLLDGVVYTEVPLRIDWRGDEIPEGPPDKINVGPVSEDERGKWGARYDGSVMVDEFADFPERGNATTEERQRIREKQASLLTNFTDTQVHPDFKVKGKGSNTYFGEGRWEDENASGGDYYRKTFRWEIYFK